MKHVVAVSAFCLGNVWHCQSLEKMLLHSHGLTLIFYKMMFTANMVQKATAQRLSFISPEAACGPAATL